jgi:2-keto-4-pentenoate hydratase/2-oxohepta-3-ene-1,7-dioic acid hydratase in catechol pathway
MGSRYARFVVRDGSIHTGEYRGDTVRSNGTSYAISEVQLLTPTAPTKLVCVGLNYRDHADELRMAIPDEPLLFLKPPSSLVAHGTAIVRPPGVNRLDFEGELCVVIGQRATRVSTTDALEYVAGLTIANDVTAREYQVPGSQWTRAKGYDTFAPVGPCVAVSRDWSGRAIETWVNGKRVQSSSTDRLIFDVPTLVSHISAIMTLEPGDLILTGTPSGVGPLQDGDEVRVSIEGIGELVNVVAP